MLLRITCIALNVSKQLAEIYDAAADVCFPTNIAQFCCGCAADPVSRFRLTVGTMSLLIPVVVVFQCLRAFGLLQAVDVWEPIKSFDIMCVCATGKSQATRKMQVDV